MLYSVETIETGRSWQVTATPPSVKRSEREAVELLA